LKKKKDWKHDVNMESEAVSVGRIVLTQNSPLEESLQRMSDAIFELTMRMSRMDDFVQNESLTIESEMTCKARSALRNMYPGYTIFEPLPMFPELQHFYVPENGQVITEFDGLFIVTDDPTYALPVQAVENPLTTEKDTYKTFFVVVEAKHALTSKSFRFKIEQIVKIQQAFKLARDIRDGLVSPDAVTPSFLWRMSTFRYADFEEEVHLFIGGPLIKSGTLEYITGIARQLWKEPQDLKMSEKRTVQQRYPIRTSIIYPQGYRYESRDVGDDFK
jgi:hypothetical protein